ncbi:MAG: hypothetical protein ACRCZI_12490 [Cetobacterium sp.]
MDDYETFIKRSKKRSKKKCSKSKEDFISMFSDLFNTINYKVAILLFIIGLFIFSDIFIELFLVDVGGAVDGDETTTKGTMIQLTLLTVGYIIADLLVAGDVV